MSGRLTILSLCDYTGNWAAPYADEYDIVAIDMQRGGEDVRLLTLADIPRPVHGVIAAPPCTVFANSGARWPRSDDDMREALSVVDACLRIVVATRPACWRILLGSCRGILGRRGCISIRATMRVLLMTLTRRRIRSVLLCGGVSILICRVRRLSRFLVR
jgi:hypothetical protein